MGSAKSKSKNMGKKKIEENAVWIRNDRVQGSSSRQNTAEDMEDVETRETFDSRFIRFLKNQFENETEMFLLDQLMLSVLFFENYETDIQEYLNPKLITYKEKELNKTLFAEQKQMIMPDAMFEKMDKNVLFRHTHGPNKKHSEPIIPQRLYITHENIEVLDPEENQDYNRIDKPHVTVMPEKSKSNGFVKLKVDQFEEQKENNNKATRKSKEDLQETEKQQTKTKVEGKEEEEIYTYATITEAKTPKQIDVRESVYLKLPVSWIKEVKVENYDEEDDDEEEEHQNTKDEDEPFIIKHYCDSKIFMKYFESNVFPHRLGKLLNFDEETIKKSTSIPGTIFCTSIDIFDKKLNFEVVPSIAMPWPGDFAYEFTLRNREGIFHKFSNKIYVWPTKAMVSSIKSFKCVVIAKGFTPKRVKNTESHLEWELCFPKAERYLQCRMTHSQIKAFLSLVTLFKTFIEPVTEKQGLLVEHLRTFMFWQCEKECYDWNNRLLGKRVVDLLKQLCTHLGKNRLSDFFVKSKNLFENIPGKLLQCAHEKFHNIQERPLMHFISSFRNLHYIQQNQKDAKFYPPLDYKHLHNILTNPGIKYVNPGAFQTSMKKPTLTYSTTKLDKHQKFQKKLMNKLNKEKQMKEQNQENDGNNQRRESVDSIDYKFDKYKIDNFDILKKKVILTFFMDHFMKIAETSLKLANVKQARFYAKQAYYLCNLIEESLVEDVENYSENICKLQEKCDKRLASLQMNLPPNIPTRNSAIPPEVSIQIHGSNQTINLQNISNSYNEGFRN